jgi:hypothetical protein
VSPSLRDRLIVGLTPAGVQFARYGRGLRPRLKDSATVHCAEADGEPWRPALEALARELPRRAAGGPACEVVLSNHFVRYQLVPWRAELRAREERVALAQAQYRSVFGAAAQQWAVRLASTGYGATTLACAVDRPLVEELARLLKAAGARPAAVEPYLAAAFNRWRRELRAPPYWLALLEPGRLWVGQATVAGWASISARRIGADPLDETLAILAQEAAVNGTGPAPIPTYLIAAGLDRERVRELRENGMKVLSADPNALLSLGEGGGIH